jgi:uncharacterized protein YdhG (YjbR/CyaY superfamily)
VAKTSFKSVDEYIASQPEAVQRVLTRVRAIIRKAAPGAAEAISYQIPTFKMRGRAVIYFAAWKQHYSLYPSSDRLVKAFKDDLAPYEVSKGTIRFPLSEPVPAKLIAGIAKFRLKEVVEREKAKPAAAKKSLGRARRSALALTATLLLLPLAESAAQDSSASWLDRPLANWNHAGEPVPKAPAGDETIDSVISRCQLTPPKSTVAEQAVAAAGCIPFWNFDQQLVRDDVEIIAGMRGADGMCRPATYNVFVFVGGRFAGVLSPTPMMSRMDSSSGAVRMALPLITTEYARYTSSDPLCCPSSRVTVRFRVDRTDAGPVVVPVDIRITRP